MQEAKNCDMHQGLRNEKKRLPIVEGEKVSGGHDECVEGIIRTKAENVRRKGKYK
jgi:hypothetical protein